MTPTALAAWRKLARSLSTAGLQALQRGLLNDDPQLIQGESGNSNNEILFSRGDFLSYALAMGDGVLAWSVLTVMRERHMQQVNAGNTSGVVPGWELLGWWDSSPRAEAFAELAELVSLELQTRNAFPVSVSLC